MSNPTTTTSWLYFLLFWIIPMMRNFSIVVSYLLEFTRCKTTCCLLQNSLVTGFKLTCYSLIIAEVARCKIHSLLVAKIVCCKKSLATQCRSCSLQKITRYLLQSLLITSCRLCFLLETFYSVKKNFC